METMISTKKNVDYIYNINDLKNQIILTIEDIEKWMQLNNYRLKGNLGEFKFEILRIDNLYDLSKRQIKKINRYMFFLKSHKTLKKVNSFFSLFHHLLTTTNSISGIKVIISEKEENIQKARKEMLKAKELYEFLLRVYKEEKSDYYKNK